MKITNTTLAILCATLVLIFGMIVTLSALGRDPSQLLSWAGTVIVPAVIGLVAVNKADKAEKNSAQAVVNTNGRMSELLGLLHQNNIPIPVAYADISPSIPANAIPAQYQGDEQGPEHLA